MLNSYREFIPILEPSGALITAAPTEIRASSLAEACCWCRRMSWVFNRAVRLADFAASSRALFHPDSSTFIKTIFRKNSFWNYGEALIDLTDTSPPSPPPEGTVDSATIVTACFRALWILASDSFRSRASSLLSSWGGG